jgi:uncharacterized repeat protein (TIGR03803 family)
VRLANLGYTLGLSAAVAMLFGCGALRQAQDDMQPPLTTAPAENAPQRSLVHHAYRVLHNFGALGDGMNPVAGLITINGTFYGTTSNGGVNDAGTVFEIKKFGKEAVLHSFGGSGDGLHPVAGLINVNGTLYGTTSNGGASGVGTVFEIKKSGKETVLHSFGGTSDGDGDGAGPYAGLLNVDGTLYGTTIGGGGDFGTVFAITKSGAETVLHSFGAPGDGAEPVASLISVNGTLYGTTEYGGAYGYGSYGFGTVFEIKKSGAETVLHSFPSGSADGTQPLAGLLNVGGTLYGTASEGGANCDGSGGCGMVFKITTSGTETVFYSFKGDKSSNDGYYPVAGLVNVNGTLYGTTLAGGANGDGTVFAITKSGKETVLHSFKGGSDGSAPEGLVQLDGALYGTTDSGGAYGDGTVFSLKP